MGLRYFSAEEYFPRTRLDLWSSDGVHLSDCEGMGILTQLLWTSTEQFLETPPPPPPVSPTPSQPLRKFSPKLVVKGEVRAPLSPDPFQWKVVGQSSKSQVPSQASVAQQQEKESFLPLNPMWFSSTALRAMEEVSPSQLSDVPSPPARKVASPAAARRRRTTERRSPRHQSPVNNLVGSPPVRFSCSLGDPATPCCSPVAKVARMQTPSPAGLSQTLKAAACHSPRPAKTVWTPDPSSTCWPWIINDGLSASHSSSKEVRTFTFGFIVGLMLFVRGKVWLTFN
ncbi:chromosome alignment-maintaining phosphoprotein 1-like isoform X2 [Sparus aurata]|uniref:chromosome alignment-maintaining phosphoprotein 1-like isoform X2 n=1 Tax=Sparus aurata TaxID=8175 RepID=UPI0011C10EB7|nr:chromosome alignment-maintaining phosphoprotein 1-like isoform X2 [Sparus aurata]